jgi:hypothetical protein
VTRRPWGRLQDDLLRELYADMLTRVLAIVTKRSERGVYERARSLGLKKSAAYLSSEHAGRLGAHTVRGVGTRFKPGHQPWNKGKPFIAGGRSAQTRFRPGRPAHDARNYRPIGDLRINADGYLERKVTDDPTLVPARRWVGVHRLVWEAANGPVPPGHVVTFKPGRRTTDPDQITLDAVELTARVDLMRRNTRHNYPPEVSALMQLRGALNRKINNRTRRHEKQNDRRA